VIEQLPALQIVVPLVSAPICLLLRRRLPALVFALGAAWACFGIAATLLLRVLGAGPIRYALGGWAAPWGIEYRIDVLSAFVLLFVSGVGAVVLSYAPRSLAREIPRDRQHQFVAVYLLCLTGLLGICITGDLFNLFVFLEISALSSYILISLGKRRRALTASFQYLVMGTIGATFILIGIGLLYMMTGTLNMLDMALRLGEVDGTRTVLVAFAFFTVGVALKMALFPLHLWLPDAYTYAPSVVSAFLAGTATKVSVYILLRFVFTVYGDEFAFVTMELNRLLLPLAVVAIFIPSTVAIFQPDVKRLLAYSSLAQIGYIVLGISIASADGLAAGITHMFNHAVMKTALFLAVGCVAYSIGSTRLEDLSGLGRRMPVTAFLWTLGGLGLVGVPLTAGFISKWYLLRAALERGWWPVAVLMLLSSLLALAYVWRFVEVAYFREPPVGAGANCEAPAVLVGPTALMIAAMFYFGLSTSWSAGVARQAAEDLLVRPTTERLVAPPDVGHP
jgi:multicomponent Na+:H+ antiporter subunit D